MAHPGSTGPQRAAGWTLGPSELSSVAPGRSSVQTWGLLGNGEWRDPKTESPRPLPGGLQPWGWCRQHSCLSPAGLSGLLRGLHQP